MTFQYKKPPAKMRVATISNRPAMVNFSIGWRGGGLLMGVGSGLEGGQSATGGLNGDGAAVVAIVCRQNIRGFLNDVVAPSISLECEVAKGDATAQKEGGPATADVGL